MNRLTPALVSMIVATAALAACQRGNEVGDAPGTGATRSGTTGSGTSGSGTSGMSGSATGSAGAASSPGTGTKP